jgi:hypothetical protein
MLLRGYFGERERTRVFGRWKVVERRTLRALWEWAYAIVSKRDLVVVG